MNDPDDATVHYTVKELLAGIQKEQTQGFVRIEVAMSGKADKADVARLETRLDAHGKALDDHRGQISELQIQTREEERARQVTERTNAWWHTRFAKVGGFLVGAALVVTSGVTIVQIFH